jgi:hypothetical protein
MSKKGAEMKKFMILTAAIFACAARVGAISLTMGNAGTATSQGDTTFGGGTLVDMNAPANATGSITTVQIAWVNSPCPNAGKIKIFHRVGNTLIPAAEESFSIPSSSARSFSITLGSPLPVQQGDLLGVYNPGTCNGPSVDTRPFTGFYQLLTGSGQPDPTSPIAFDPAADLKPGALAIAATGIVTESRVGVITGVGSGPGSNGSHFKTSLQMIAFPFGGDINGKLVFHPVGVGGSAADPAFPFTIAQGHALAFQDVVTDMGQTGFGSIDLVLAAGSAVPVTVARVFNQASDGGTSGLGEELVNTAGGFAGGGLAVQVIPAGFTGFVSAPPNTENTRFNLGVRTLDLGATVNYVLKRFSGETKASKSETYPPNYFNQVDAAVLFGVIGIEENDFVEVSVSTGSAIVYGSSTDDRTNDPSVQFVYPVFGVV